MHRCDQVQVGQNWINQCFTEQGMHRWWSGGQYMYVRLDSISEMGNGYPDLVQKLDKRFLQKKKEKWRRGAVQAQGKTHKYAKKK